MSLIAREQIAPCELPEEVVTVAAIGGDVLVRGMDMPQLIRFRARQRAVQALKRGEKQEDADQRAGAELMPILLEMTVMAGDGEPVYSAAQWGVFTIKHQDDALQLCGVAMRLSGLEKEPGKS